MILHDIFFLSSVDHSRICLQLGANDYINASLITVEEAQRNYILTQVSEEASVPLQLKSDNPPLHRIGYSRFVHRC